MPRGPRKLVISFNTKALTHYGGVYLLHRFLTRIGFKNAVASEMRLAQRNNRYTVGQLVLAVLYPMMLGLERLETTRLLRENGVFQYLTGLPTYPDPTTLRRFLLRAAPTAVPALRRMHDRLLQRMTRHGQVPRRLIFDLDSTVLIVYGQQENARVGYSPKRHGARSYHPLLCFEGQSRDFWHGELRPGDVHTARGTRELLTACRAKVPAGVRRVIVRADKGFFDRKLMEWITAQRWDFVIVAPLTPAIKRRLGQLRYRRVSRGVEAATFYHRRTRRPWPYRFVVIGRPQPEEPSAQLTLFKLGRYYYQVLVSNLRLQPLQLWRFYNERAGIELLIRQLKGDYALGSIPSRHVFANEAYFHLLLLAYNLINWFKRLCLPPELQAVTLQTLRHRILLMPALLQRSGNRPRLALPVSGRHQAAWHHALRAVERITV